MNLYLHFEESGHVKTLDTDLRQNTKNLTKWSLEISQEYLDQVIEKLWKKTWKTSSKCGNLLLG